MENFIKIKTTVWETIPLLRIPTHDELERIKESVYFEAEGLFDFKNAIVDEADYSNSFLSAEIDGEKIETN